jgi:hypothetical protein
MRRLSLENETIRICAFSGERKNIRVSGIAKAHLLWLFRNFYILDFSVLNKKQQQLVAQVWHGGASTGSAAAPPDLIGTIEGFSAQSHEALVPAAARPRLEGARSGGPITLRPPAIWSAVGVLLLGCAIGLAPKRRWTPESRESEVAVSIPVSSTVVVLARASAQSAPAVADLPAAASEAPTLPPADAEPPVAAPPADLPVAAPPKVKPAHLRIAGSPAVNPKPVGKPEATRGPDVIIQVSADAKGRPQEFRILRGEQKKIPAALAAARHWSFPPSSAGCEHLLTFTDHGDASIVQMIE